MSLYLLNDFILCAMEWPSEKGPVYKNDEKKYESTYSVFAEELREMGLDPEKMFTLNPLIYKYE